MTSKLKPKASATPRVPIRSPARIALPGPPIISTVVPTTSAANARELLISMDTLPGRRRGRPRGARSVTMALRRTTDRGRPVAFAHGPQPHGDGAGHPVARWGADAHAR